MIKPEQIGKIVQIASALEVSGYPKPGNVHRTRDFDDMVFEDFIISGIVIGDIFTELAERTIENKENLSEIALGKTILDAVSETNNWVENNTNLGIVMMTSVLAAAAALSEDLTSLRLNVEKVMNATTVQDALDLYDAINLASAGGMGSQGEYDVNDDSAKQELIANRQTMFKVLKISAGWDDLACEMTTGMPIVFTVGYPTYADLRRTHSMNYASVLTFLTILSKFPDTLICRKYGKEMGQKVSDRVSEVLKHKDDDNFHDVLVELDDNLFENHLNPGTSADLTAASIMVYYLVKEFEKKNNY